MSPKSFPARSRAEPLEPLSLRFSVAADIINPILSSENLREITGAELEGSTYETSIREGVVAGCVHFVTHEDGVGGAERTLWRPAEHCTMREG
jgi:hypothetical protein